MGMLSSVNLIFARSAFLLFLAFSCLKDVNIILENPSVLLLTQAMDLPALVLSAYSAQLGLFSLFFFLMAVNDIIPLLEKNTKYFQSIVPLRSMIFFIITALSYYWQDNLYIHNNAVFIYSFCELWINFLIFSAVREERVEEFKTRNEITLEEPVEEVDIVMTSSQELEAAEYDED